MGHTLEQFASQCHDFLKNSPGPAGRQKVAEALNAMAHTPRAIVLPAAGELAVALRAGDLAFVRQIPAY